MEITSEALTAYFRVVLPLLDERQRRLVAAATVPMLGRGGQARVAEATGLSRNTLIGGAKELESGAGPSERVRRPGGGRKKATDINPDLLAALDSLVEPESRGDPMSPLRWTLKSTRRLATELTRMGHQASSFLVGQLLHYMDYSLQGTSKQNEGAQHADRDAQFHHINAQAKAHLAAAQPVISVDCKKKELVGDYANGGTEWQPAGRPTRVGVHDFPDPEMGKAIPYGVYDLFADEGWVSVGDHHDTAAFAVATIRRWWERMGHARYPNATRLLITADAGGSNSARSRLWKLELARLAADIGLAITVCHFPPGTSKWNKIEHRLFSFISMNWRGQPLTSYRVVVELIAGTTTRSGLNVQAEFDEGYYPTGVKVTDEELAAIALQPNPWHGDWNYSLGGTPLM